MIKTIYNEIKVAAARTALFNNIKDVVEKINIHDVLKLSSGENLPTHKMIDGNYPVFGGGGETGLTHNIFNVDFETLAIGRVGARCGCVFKVPKQSWVTDNALYALSFDKRFLLDFLIHYLNYVDLNQYANRAAQPVISLKRISSISFPLIDEAKQKAFIEIIEQVGNGETNFGNEYSELNNALKSVDRINELQDELSHQLTLLSNLNQAILQEAVQGKLVPQDPNDEPASELLKRIKAALRQAQGSKKIKELPPIQPEEIPFEIPENWVWCRLGEICDVLGGFAFDSTRYSKIETQNQVIRLGNVKPNQLVLETSPVFIDDKYAYEVEKSILKQDDILITMTGTKAKRDYLFSLCLSSDDLKTKKLFLNQRVGCFRFDDTIFPAFINYALKDLALLTPVFDSSTGAANQANIGMIALKGILIPLPPLSEQKRIVAAIEKQFALTQQLKEKVLANQQSTEQLLKALLHQAFEVREVKEVNS